MSIDINRFKNACKEFLEASGHKVISTKVINDEVHLEYRQGDDRTDRHVVFRPWG